ncbi:hypothetical protein JVU11DRAFT_86 [Chiua virens]|nr:hypothetical protein JVU11DRAFT_86 [Chiua virens]
MTSQLVLSNKDPRRSDFVLAGHHDVDTLVTYTSHTAHYPSPRNGARATTTVTRTDPTGDRLQVGVIDWPVRSTDTVQVVVGTRDVSITKSGIFTSSEWFTAADGGTYEWQIRDGRPQLVPLADMASTAYVATFVQSQSGFWLLRKHTSSLFVPPEGLPILDDIIVTFIYFESKWRDKEATRSRARLSGFM